MMTPPLWSRVGPFAAAALMLIGGGLKYPSGYSTALVAGGFVVLGSWLTVEIAAIIDTEIDRDSPGETQGERD